MNRNWAVVPYINCETNTKDTVLDLLAQTVPVTVLLIDNGSDLEIWNEMRKWSAMVTGENPESKILPWRHSPPLPSLAASWNTALDFVWASGGLYAMVCNNDIRMKPWIYAGLEYMLGIHPKRPLFVSGVNHPEGYEKMVEGPWDSFTYSTGGPDFSCYMITKEGHTKYRFDENFTPAYCEDLDMHRRYMLGGDGNRIFSVSLPYLHKEGGSGTLKAFSKERAEHFHRAVEAGSRSYYRAKWGGGANEEKWAYPFGNPPNHYLPLPHACEHVTTPQLQSHGCRGGRTD